MTLAERVARLVVKRLEQEGLDYPIRARACREIAKALLAEADHLVLLSSDEFRDWWHGNGADSAQCYRVSFSNKATDFSSYPVACAFAVSRSMHYSCKARLYVVHRGNDTLSGTEDCYIIEADSATALA